jgi:hypothetical protein
MEQRRGAGQENVIESEIPNGSKSLSESDKRAERSGNCSADTVVLSSSQ